jgi:hypothetical protein
LLILATSIVHPPDKFQTVDPRNKYDIRCTLRVEKFKSTEVFRQQFEIAQTIVEIRDTRVLLQMESWLSQDASHARTMRVADESGVDTIVSNHEEPMAGSDAPARARTPSD